LYKSFYLNESFRNGTHGDLFMASKPIDAAFFATHRVHASAKAHSSRLKACLASAARPHSSLASHLAALFGYWADLATRLADLNAHLADLATRLAESNAIFQTLRDDFQCLLVVRQTLPHMRQGFLAMQ
jgi:ABC-type transporter Mla subunit MlaD